MPLSEQEQKLLDEELAETRKRLESWVHRELSAPVAQGQGRNNQMIKLAPRMIELGFDEDGVFEKFKEMYDLEEDDSCDFEIRKVIKHAAKYASEIVPKDPDEVKREKAALAAKQMAAAAAFKRVMTHYQWPENEIIRTGGCEFMSPSEQREAFLHTLFDPDDVIWSGMVKHSGAGRNGSLIEKHKRHFKTVARWLDGTARSFEFVSHCTFHPGSYSRSNDNVERRCYAVVESDTLGRDEIGGVFNWLNQGGLKLRAVVFSGGKSLHGWFDWPDEITDIAAELVGMHCDPSTLRPSQPVRMPGVVRKDSQKLQQLLYLSA